MAQISPSRHGGVDPWRDFDRLRREMNALLGNFGSASPLASGHRGVYPAVNLYETDDAYVLTAELPGVAGDDIRVLVEGNTVTVEGARQVAYADEEGVSLHRRERQSGRFRRAFELPAAIAADAVEAVHRNGVLELRLTKTPEAQPRQISVKAG